VHHGGLPTAVIQQVAEKLTNDPTLHSMAIELESTIEDMETLVEIY